MQKHEYAGRVIDGLWEGRHYVYDSRELEIATCTHERKPYVVHLARYV